MLNVCTQVFMENFPNRSVRLDILAATDSINKTMGRESKNKFPALFFPEIEILVNLILKPPLQNITVLPYKAILIHIEKLSRC